MIVQSPKCFYFHNEKIVDFGILASELTVELMHATAERASIMLTAHIVLDGPI